MENFTRPRPAFPKRAIITSGMPYGNKLLHYGHVGMALRADIFARFMKDRIGKENVIFVSGTDCYGSPAVESFRMLKEEGKLDPRLTIEEYIAGNHKKQKEIFENFEVVFDLYGASALGRSGQIHKEVSREFINKLIQAGMVSKHGSWQFFDTKCNCLLNGRQVVGKCPIEGCTSEKGYADECDLGHQYLPQDLIDPVSKLSGEKPKLVKVENLYFNLEDCTAALTEWINKIDRTSDTPSFMIKEIREFFKKPEVYIKREYFDVFESIKEKLPKHEVLPHNEKAPSITVVFEKLTDREEACQILAKNSIRYRTGKTLTPFRLTGDISWGVPCPEILGIKNQTFYVWPESLWAPISFTKTYLEEQNKGKEDWKKFWCSKDAKVYQFLGEDNLYFYGPAQQAMFMAVNGKLTSEPKDGELQLTKINPIKSILYMNAKASSSGSIKPPMAMEFLKYYTAEQFRMHFLAMNLTNNNVSLAPKVFNPDAKPEDLDPFVAEGNLLTNVYNRILRTIFYTTQSVFDGNIPQGTISAETKEACQKAILDTEKFMFDKKFHLVYNTLDVFIRNINKFWVKEIATADTNEKKANLIVNALQMAITACALLHPIVPKGSENVADYIGLDKQVCFDWKNIFNDFFDILDKTQHRKLKFLKEREDFFKKSDYQLAELAKKNSEN